MNALAKCLRVAVLVGLLFSGLLMAASAIGFAAAADAPATQWSQTYGGTDWDYAECVVQTSDGGYALAGYTASFGAGYSDFWLVKTDASGTLQWSQNYGGPGSEWAYCVVQTSDGGYALAGRTASFGAGSNDFWLVKTAPDSLFVVPESAFGALGTIVACITAMAIIATNKKRQTK